MNICVKSRKAVVEIEVKDFICGKHFRISSIFMSALFLLGILHLHFSIISLLAVTLKTINRKDFAVQEILTYCNNLFEAILMPFNALLLLTFLS